VWVCDLVCRVKGGTGLRVFREQGAAEVFGPESRKLQELGENCIMKSFMICNPREMLGWSKQGRLDGRNMWHVLGRRQIHAGFRWGNLCERHHFEGIDCIYLIQDHDECGLL
jgi:hypothetical protein